MRLSVVIPVYDRFEITVTHVREAMNNTRVPDEIIVVNDGGDPKLKEMLKTVEKKTKLIYARINEDICWNYMGACNLGFWISTGDLVAFEDNDNIPTKDLYECQLKYLEEHPNIGRLNGGKRWDISESQLAKPSSEWVMESKRNPNMGTAMMRREFYYKIKGYDERFSGNYGWMYYDIRVKLLDLTDTGKAGNFWYVKDGQSKIDHKVSSTNFAIFRRNRKLDMKQSPEGIINFTYSVEEL